MGIYLLKSTAILVIFWIFYILFLEKENIHQFKRFYLLTSIVSAFCIPLLSITEYIYVDPVDSFEFTNDIIPFVNNETLPIVDKSFWTLNNTLLTIYSIGVLIFSVRFFINIFKMIKTITVNEKQKQSSITFVLLKQLINPHTFFSFIFLNKSKFQKREVPEEVILHEETHARQKHSLDIIFIELLQIIFWFQPFIWLYKKRIKLNHEFLADQAVINSGCNPSSYQNTLLSYSSHQDYSLSNAIHYSSIKKRFTVMKTQTSQQKKWLLSLLVLPIFGILFFSFSEREIVEVEASLNNNESSIIAFQKNSNNNSSIGAPSRLMKEYKDFIKKYNQTKIIYGEAYERAIIIYDDIMSEEQRASVEKYPPRLIPKSNLSKKTPKQLSRSLFNDLKNPEKFAVWIDKKHVSNSELNNYNYSDFVHYTGSFVHKNARSIKFPQPNQYHLFTKTGFENTYKNSQLRKYNNAVKKYSSALKEFLDGPRQDNFELKILYRKALDIYNTFSKEDIKIHNIKTPPPTPAMVFNESSKSEQKTTPSQKEIDEYNAWAKQMKAKFKTMPESEKVNGVPHMINDKVFRKHNAIYDRMTKKQKANAESLPEAVLVTEWPMPTAVLVSKIDNQQKPATAKEVAEYNAWAKKLKEETIKAHKREENGKPANYPIVKQKELVKYQGIYSRMTKEQREKSLPNPISDNELKAIKFPPPPPPAPKKGNNDLPPPPPPPKASDKQVAAYNSWAEKMNKINNTAKANNTSEYAIIKLKDAKKYKAIYDSMTNEQRKNVQPFPEAHVPKPHPGYNKKEKGGPTASNLKLVMLDDKPEDEIIEGSYDYKIRQLILKVSNELDQPVSYYTDGNKGDYFKAKEFLLKNQDADIRFSEGETISLLISKKKGEMMNENQLQNLYTKLFKYYKNSQEKIAYAYKMPSSKECLEFPQSFNTTKGNTLVINCIGDYPNNKFDVYNRWGNLIYSKENYNNTWDGTVNSEFAEEGSTTAKSGTYYYVFESKNLQEAKTGYLEIIN